mgnify:FL=1
MSKKPGFSLYLVFCNPFERLQTQLSPTEVGLESTLNEALRDPIRCSLESSIGAAVAHDAVTQDVALTLGVVVLHFCRYHFADIRHFAHRYNFGDVQVSGVSVFLDHRLLLCDISRDLVCHGGCAQTAEGQNQ